MDFQQSLAWFARNEDMLTELSKSENDLGVSASRVIDAHHFQEIFASNDLRKQRFLAAVDEYRRWYGG